MSAAAALRALARTVTPGIGALDASYLGTGRALGPARVLYELPADGLPVAALRDRLGLDGGYLSRLLGDLACDGLVELRADPSDGRRRVAVPTAAGHAERDRLEARSAQRAETMVAALGAREQARLAEALATAQRLLRGAAVRLETVDAAQPEAVAAVAAYLDELVAEHPAIFDPQDARADGGVAQLRPPDGAFVLARDDSTVVGCGGVRREAERTAEIKRMWVDPAWRGTGLAQRLLARLEDEARRLGHERVVLDTNAELAAAAALYRRAGYEPVPRYNDNPYAGLFFAKPLTPSR